MHTKAPILIFLSVVALSSAAPTKESSVCAPDKCPIPFNPKFSYGVKKTYQYNYESTVELLLDGVSDDKSKIKVNAGAEFHFLTQCEVLLKLTGVKLESSLPVPNINAFKKALEEKQLLLEFEDGRISHICPDSSDQPFATNVRRSVISAFQNTMDKLMETNVREIDVNGQCDTHYEVQEVQGTTVTITKTKDLVSCTDRMGNNSRIQADSYISYTRVQSLPLMNSTHVCTQTINNGILASSVCEETHILRALKKGDKGANTHTVTKLTLKSTVNGVGKPSSKKFTTSSLLYDHSDDLASAPGGAVEAANLLSDICKKIADEIDESVPALFTKLVYVVRKINYNDIKTLYQRVQGDLCKTSRGKDTLLNAVAMSGTNNAIKFMAELLNGGSVDRIRERFWFTSFAFVRDPVSATIEATIPLIDNPKPKRLAFLGVSSLAHTFCKEHPDCETDKAIQKLFDKLVKHLGNKCKANNDEEEEKVIAALKAFGNIGRAGKHIATLHACAKDVNLHAPIRVAAIEAFRRFPCSDETSDVFLHILEDKTQDSEIRIDAYLGVVRCPSKFTVESLRRILLQENVNQVGSFIWSHINNLKETESRLKTKLRKLVEDVELSDRFSYNPRKFSTNFERSFFLDKYNLGASVESNLVYSTKSFIPRSLTTNITVDLFGRHIALFEADLRIENFEFLLENLFGQAGYFKSHTLEERLQNQRHKFKSLAEKIENSATRSKREVFYAPKPTKKNFAYAPINKPEASLSFKVFGNEIRWFNFHDFHKIRDEGTYNIDEILNKLAAHKEVDVARNVLFLDTTYSVPTATGFPLKLELNGTASFGLKLVSHFDIRKFLLRPRSADIDTFIQPSAVAEFASSLVIDAGVIKTGIRRVVNVNSNAAVHTKINLKEGEDLSVEINLPKDRIEVFHYRSDMFRVHGENQKPLQLINNNHYDFEVCTRYINEILGLKGCLIAEFPKPIFNPERPWIPVAGSHNYEIVLSKVDPEMKGFLFQVYWHREKASDNTLQKSHIRLHVDTPGSKKSREYKFEFLFDRPEKQLKVELSTPYHKGGIAGSIKTEGNNRKTQLTVNIDGEERYRINGDIKVNNQGDQVILTPSLDVHISGEKKGSIKGTITRTPGKKIEFSITSPEFPDKLTLKGFVQGDGEIGFYKPGGEVNADLELAIPVAKGHLIAHRKFTETDPKRDYELNLDLDYSLKALEWAPHKAHYKRNYHIARTDSGSKGTFFSEFTSTRIPNFNKRTTFNYEYVSGKNFNYDFTYNYGANLDDNVHKVFLTEKLSWGRPAIGTFDFDYKMKYTHPATQANYELESDFHWARKLTLEYKLHVSAGGVKKLDAELFWKNSTSTLRNYNGKLKVTTPNREVIVTHDRTETAPGKVEGKTHIQWEAGKYADISSQYESHNVVGEHFHREGTIEVKVYNSPEPIRKYHFLMHKMPGKLNAEFKVTRPDDTYYAEIEYEKAQDGTKFIGHAGVKFPSILSDGKVVGKLDVKHEPSSTTVNLDYKSPRRHIIGNWNAKGPRENRQVNAEIKWDADNDANKRIGIEATVKRPKGKRAGDIKGTITTPNRTLRGTIAYDFPEVLFNGTHLINADIEFEPKKKILLNAKINIDKSRWEHGVRISDGEVKFSSPSVPETNIKYHTKFEKEFTGERIFEADADITGGLYPGKRHLSIEHRRGEGNLKSSVEYTTDDKPFKFGFAYRRPERDEDGVTFGGGFELKTPLETLSDWAFIIDHKRKRYDDGIDIHHETKIRWPGGGKQVGLLVDHKRHFDGEQFEFDTNVELTTPIERFAKQELHFVAHHDVSETKNIKGEYEIAALWGGDQSASIEATYDGDFTDKGDVKLVVYRNKVNIFELTRSFEIDFTKPKREIKIDSVLKWKKGTDPQKSLSWTTDIKLDPSMQSGTVNLKIKTPFEKIQTASVYVDVKSKGPGSVVVKATADWAQGKTLQVDGDVKVEKDGGFASKFTFNSKQLDVNNWKLSLQKKVLGNDKRKYASDIDLGSDKQFGFELNVLDKKGGGKKFDGVVKIHGDPFINYELESTHTLKGEERERKIDLKLKSPAFTITVSTLRVWGPNKAQVRLQACPEDEKCLIFDYYRNIKANPKIIDSIDFDGHLTLQVTGLSGDYASRTAGIYIDRHRQLGNKESSLKLTTWNEKEKYLGYIYEVKTTESSTVTNRHRNFKLLLPSRIVEYNAEAKIEEKRKSIVADLKLDAKREPNRKLIFTYEYKPVADKQISIKAALKHPDHPKELTLTTTARVVNNKVILNSAFDLFKDAKKKIFVDVELVPAFLVTGRTDADEYVDVKRNFSLDVKVRQPDWLNVDSHFNIHRELGPKGYYSGAEYQWFDPESKTKKSIEIDLHLDRVEKELEAKLKTPWRLIQLQGHYELLDDSARGIGGVRAELELLKDGQIIRRALIDGSLRPQFNIKYFIDPNDRTRLFRLEGGLRDPTLFEFSASRFRNGQETHDFDFTASLNTSRLVYTSLNWRPGLYEDVKTGLVPRVDYFDDKAEEIFKNVINAASVSFQKRSTAVADAFRTEFGPTIKITREKISQLRQELREDLQKRDPEALKDIISTLLGEIVDSDAVVAGIEELRDKFRTWLKDRLTKLAEIFERLAERLATIDDIIRERLQTFPERFKAFIERLRTRIPEIGEKIRAILLRIPEIMENIRKSFLGELFERLRNIGDSIRLRFNAYMESIKGQSLWERIKVRLENYANKHPEAAPFIRGIVSSVDDFRAKVREIIDDIQDKYAAFKQRIVERYSVTREGFQPSPQLKELIEEIKALRQRLTERLQEDGATFRERLRERIRAKWQGLQDRLPYYLGKDAVFDIRNGHIAFYTPLPLPIDNLKDICDAFDKDRISQDEDLNEIRSYYRKKFFKGQDPLPPYDGHALLVGNQHYVTFDGRSFDFSGKCTYLLAADFVDRNFTVNVVYNNQGKKTSIVVESDGHTIEIGTDMKVSLDNQVVEIPFQIEDTSVERKWDDLVVINAKGFSLVHDFEYDFTVVDINGFYFGKTAGLLGTYNNEPSDDFTSPTGQNQTDVEVFSESWNTGTNCRNTDNLATPTHHGSWNLGPRDCHKYFTKETSVLEDCFNIVNPKPFFDMCEHDVREDGGCQAVAAYIEICKHAFIDLDVPNACGARSARSHGH